MDRTSDYNVLDETSLAVVRSNTFIDDALFFLCDAKGFKDTAIRTATDDCLRNLALEFCCLHLNSIFPNVHVTGVPDKCLVFEEVFKIYQKLKFEFQENDRTRLPSPPISIISARSTMQPDADAEIPATLHSMATHTSALPSTSPKQRRDRKKRRQPRSHPKTAARNADACNVTRSQIASERDSDEKITPSHEQQPEQRTRRTTESVTVASSLKSEPRMTSQAKRTSNQESDTIVARPVISVEQNQPLPTDLRQLKRENQMLTEYRTFVHNTIRICQDTYLEEAHAASRARIFQKASQCQAVVEVLRDLLSDIDFEYFHDYRRLHNNAPPARYWLDSVKPRR